MPGQNLDRLLKNITIAQRMPGSEMPLTPSNSYNPQEEVYIVVSDEDIAAKIEALTKENERLTSQNKALKSKNESLTEKVYVDGLTGVSNRRYWDEIVPNAVRNYQSQNPKESYLVFIADLDDFKRLNDTKGHIAGDEVLRYVAQALRFSIRPADDIVRYGGEEFAGVLYGVSNPIDIEKRVEHLRTEVNRLVKEETGYDVTISIGAVLCKGNEVPLSTALKMADKKLYESKEGGRNTFRIDYLPIHIEEAA